jgi:hypothetical protein
MMWPRNTAYILYCPVTIWNLVKPLTCSNRGSVNFDIDKIKKKLYKIVYANKILKLNPVL